MPRRGAENSLWPFPRNLQHRIALLLSSEKRPVRKGQILPQGYVETVKYLDGGRNIVQQENEIPKGGGITALLLICLSFRVLNLADDLAGIATGELRSVSQLNKEAEEERYRK